MSEKRNKYNLPPGDREDKSRPFSLRDRSDSPLRSNGDPFSLRDRSDSPQRSNGDHFSLRDRSDSPLRSNGDRKERSYGRNSSGRKSDVAKNDDRYNHGGHRRKHKKRSNKKSHKSLSSGLGSDEDHENRSNRKRRSTKKMHKSSSSSPESDEDLYDRKRRSSRKREKSSSSRCYHKRCKKSRKHQMIDSSSSDNGSSDISSNGDGPLSRKRERSTSSRCYYKRCKKSRKHQMIDSSSSDNGSSDISSNGDGPQYSFSDNQGGGHWESGLSWQHPPPSAFQSSQPQFRSDYGMPTMLFTDDHSISELIQLAYDNLDDMTPYYIAAFWDKLSKQIGGNGDHSKPQVGYIRMEGRMELLLYEIFDLTKDNLKYFGAKHLTLTIYGVAKIASTLRKQRTMCGEATLCDLLLDQNMKPRKETFDFFTQEVVNNFHRFDAKNLSMVAYAYALIGYEPAFVDGSDLFDHIATKALEIVAEFEPPALSSILYAFARAFRPHPVLFEAMGDQLVSFNHLNEIEPRDLSKIVWAHATANIPHTKVFEKVATYMVGLDDLNQFESHHLSNTVIGYAKAGVPHPELFDKVSNHILALDSLDQFSPNSLCGTVWAYAKAGVRDQELFAKVSTHIVGFDSLDHFTHPPTLSSIVWAYAKAGIHDQQLFEMLANHIVGFDSLHEFNSHEFSSIVWAYAKAQFPLPALFQKVSKAAIKIMYEFNPQEIANLLWAYATMGIIDKELFTSFAPAAAELIDSFSKQDISNVAWAYAVADVDVPNLFNDRFIKCIENKKGFEIESLSQLHQWHIWQAMELSHACLPPELELRCYKAFTSTDPCPSNLQMHVVDNLPAISVELQEEVRMYSGYLLDAVVEVRGKTVGIEVDGPSHFIGKSKTPTGSTILKRRQVPWIDEIELLSVPYWEWDKVRMDEVKKQNYLHDLLDSLDYQNLE